jgi:hypothetical protein
MDMETILREHPWVALLGLFPPFYLIGVIRTWGKPEYDVTLVDLIDVGISMSAAPWWPINLYRRMRRDRRWRS